MRRAPATAPAAAGSHPQPRPTSSEGSGVSTSNRVPMSGAPCAAEKNSSAEARPPPRPMMRLMGMSRCPAGAVRGGPVGYPPQLWPASRLLDHVGQKTNEASPLDGLGEFALLLGGDGRDAARHNLAPLGNVAAQQPHVLVVDLGGLIARERAGLAPAMKRPTGRDGRNLGHGSALLGGVCRRRLAIPLARWPGSPRAIPIPALAVAPETSSPATIAAQAAALAAEATALAAKAAALAIAPIVAVALAHLHGGFALVLLDANRQKADDVGGQAHAAFHLGDRGRRCVDVHERIVGLAVLLDLEGEALEAPIFGLADPPATFGDDLAVFLHQGFDLRLADILARQKYVLVERHRLAFPSVALCAPAQSPFWARGSISARKGPKDPKERRHREPGVTLPSRRGASRPPVQPPTGAGGGPCYTQLPRAGKRKGGPRMG